jgi:pimeloyl-[acyl-carrier protein] methyl ester esterase
MLPDMPRPTLVLLPGLDGTGDFFAPLLDVLSASVPTQVVRYPLAGASDYATCGAIARSALPTDRPFVLLGESFSGPIAVAIAATAPPGLAGVILSATFVVNPRPYLGVLRPLLPILPLRSDPLSIALSRFRVLGRWATPALRALHRDILIRLPPETVRSRLEAVINCDVREAMRSVHVPVLSLVAQHDRLIPRSASRVLQQHAPTATVVELNAPHCLLQCVPLAAADTILTFIDSISTSREIETGPHVSAAT